MNDRTRFFDRFIAAHIAYIQDIHDKLSSNTISHEDIGIACRDNLCEIGLWLESIAPDLGMDKLYLETCVVHSRFHNTISNIIGEHLAGDRASAMDKLDKLLSVHGGCFHSMRATLKSFLFGLKEQTIKTFHPRVPGRDHHHGPNRQAKTK
ncbi:MAG TPA: hypothetical protein HPQ04_02255 [Rhodospirillaceae bacterium]|nr:hypothetical protein [Rhodospirillaceae bacterium]